jgi:hypothetical protein
VRDDVAKRSVHFEPVVDHVRDAQLAAVDGFLRALATKSDVAGRQTGAAVEVVVLQPGQCLTLRALTAFRDDPRAALEQRDQPGNDVERTHGGWRLNRVFQTRTEKAGVGRAIWAGSALDHAAEIDAEHRVRQTSSLSTPQTRASARTGRTTG